MKKLVELTETSGLQKRSYQMTIPVIICSVIIGIFIADYLVTWGPLQSMKTAISEFQGTVTNMVNLYAIAVLYIVNFSRIARYRRTQRREVFIAAVVLGTSIFLALFFLSQPGYETAPASGIVQSTIVGALTNGLFAMRYAMVIYWVVKRITQFRTVERVAQLVVWTVIAWRDTPIFVSAMPWLLPVGDWLRAVLYTGAQRGLLISISIATIVLALRALLGREKGIIDLETVI
jgi:hypothetical protein